ncbi:hypothetical protein TTRE_0000773501 [Trichuris trichiura]|uniref:Uncharacterized protein n=1 Tax=Trichuris trichiura TaxID=36087 RepID=A0A077ZGC1_TRITR|nr:hypothetical protein TTRE_0000773501 [Trichuris trichiura]
MHLCMPQAFASSKPKESCKVPTQSRQLRPSIVLIIEARKRAATPGVQSVEDRFGKNARARARAHKEDDPGEDGKEGRKKLFTVATPMPEPCGAACEEVFSRPSEVVAGCGGTAVVFSSPTEEEAVASPRLGINRSPIVPTCFLNLLPILRGRSYLRPNLLYVQRRM